jgi:hypothetical protein
MAQTPVQGLLYRQEPCGEDPSKRARAHCHTQAWARYRGLVEKYQEGYQGILLQGFPHMEKEELSLVETLISPPGLKKLQGAYKCNQSCFEDWIISKREFSDLT